MAEFPVLDLSQSPEEVAEACRRACEDHGFFLVKNHGISDEVLAAHANAQLSFFALPLAKKLSIKADDNNRGYTRMGEETLDPKRSVKGDAKEGLYFGREVDPASEEGKLPLHGPNQWPDEAELSLPGYRGAVEAYMKQMTALGFSLLSVLARALGLPADHFLQYFQQPMLFLRPLHYAAERSNEAGGAFAAGAHSDYGCLTLLWTDGTPGLQILHEGQEWIDIPPTPGCFICNVGDMLERWTAGRFASTVHRVINPLGKDRYSCAFFLDPSFTAEVEPLPGCVAPGSEAAMRERYPKTTAGGHLLAKYAATHDDYRQKMESGAAKV